MVNLARQQRAGTLERIDVPKTVKQVGSLRNSLLQFVQRSGLSTETEIAKDTWTGAVFGIGGYLHFENISQP